MKYFLLLSLLTLPAAVFAAEQAFVPLTSIPGLTDTGNSLDLPIFLNNFYKICIGLASILAVLQLIRAGLMYMMGDSITEKKEARNLIGLSVLGLILVLSPVIVFGLINKDILELNLDVKVLAPKRTPNVELEADKLFTATQGVTLVSGQQCSDVLGEGWESTPNGAFGNTVNKYCPFLSVGQTCCGRIPSTASSDVPLGVISYTIGYKSSDFKNLGAACFASETVTATTQPECVGLMLDAKQAHPDGEILKECNESVVRQPSPALAALPMCSK